MNLSCVRGWGTLEEAEVTKSETFADPLPQLPWDRPAGLEE